MVWKYEVDKVDVFLLYKDNKTVQEFEHQNSLDIILV